MNEAVQTLSRYAGFPLPKRPRLAPWAVVIDLGDGRLQFRSPQFSFTLGHTFFIDIFLKIQPLLDGEHNAEDIAEAGGQGIQSTSVLFLLKMLAAVGLLQEAEAPEGLKSESLSLNRQIQFWGLRNNNPWSVQAALSRAQIALLGSTELSDAIAAALASMGITAVQRIAPPAPDSRTPPGEHLAALADNKLTPDTMLVVPQETPGYSHFEAINTFCLRRNLRWMHVAVEGTTALVGPTVIPYQTACYTCYDLRVRSNTRDVQGFLAYRRQLADNLENGSTIPDFGVLIPFWSMIAGHVALEIARIMTGFEAPATIGRCFEVSTLTPAITQHTVLRVPRCPSCNVSPPAQRAWDLPEL